MTAKLLAGSGTMSSLMQCCTDTTAPAVTRPNAAPTLAGLTRQRPGDGPGAACGHVARRQSLRLLAALSFLSARFSLRDLLATVFAVDFLGDLSAMVASSCEPPGS